MPKTREQIIKQPNWAAAREFYYGSLSLAANGDAVERYGAQTYKLHRSIPSQQEFWRSHIAPATNRPNDQFLVPGVNPIISRMAELNYEVFCNLVDAFETLTEVRKGLDAPPRYRKNFAVWRYAGDAIMILDELGRAIEGSGRFKGAGLANRLGRRISILSDDFIHQWKDQRDAAIQYRNTLSHHGRPWLYFKGESFSGVPYIRWEGSIAAQDHSHEARDRQEQEFRSDRNSGKFVTLPDASERVADLTCQYVEAVYFRIGGRLSFALNDDLWFRRYRKLWAWP